jgi:hypothetical protein
MLTAVNSDLRRGSRLREFASLRRPWFVGILFAILTALQALGFLVLGTGRVGLGLSESVLVVDCLLAFACGWIAFRRAQGITALFWFLFAIVNVVLMVPTAFQAYDTLSGQILLSDSTRSLLYTLYGAPVLMMLFLPGTHRRTRVKSEIFLDLFQVAIVVGLIYSTFFFLPVRQMLPADALPRDITVSDAQSLLLLIAALVRLQFAGIAGSRSLLIRLVIFLLVCAVATFAGDWIYLRNDPALIAWSDLVWAIPEVAAAFIALTWIAAPEHQSAPESANFFSFLGINLVLVAMLSCMALLMDRWKQANGEILTNVAIAPRYSPSPCAWPSRNSTSTRKSLIAKRHRDNWPPRIRQSVTCSTTHAAKPPKSPRSANSEASSRPAPRAKKSFASSRSVCVVCFPAPPAAFRYLAPLKTVSSRPRNGGFVRLPRFSLPNNVGLFVGDAPMPILVGLRPRAVLTCSGKGLRYAFLSLPMAKLSEPYPSKKTFPSPPFRFRMQIPTPSLADASSQPPSPNTSRSQSPTLTSVNLSACKRSATRSPAFTTAATCRSSLNANSTPPAASGVPWPS